MIMAQEQAFLKSQQQLQAMADFLAQAQHDGERIDRVERELFSQLLLIGKNMLEGFVNAHGNGDVGPQCTHKEQTRERSETPQPRRYLSIFGELTITRFVYAQRAHQQQFAPLDAQLSLPGDDFSYVLQDWLQRLCVKESFHEGVTSLRTLLGIAPSERAAEQMNQRLAEYAERFQLTQTPPPDKEEGELLVATADGKGVPMRRPLQQRVRSQPRRGKGEKANKKQMAYVGAVYSIDRFQRTAEDVVNEVQRRERRADRPVPQHKQVWAEMTRVWEGDATSSGRERLFAELAVSCHDRDPQHRKTLICLLDGEPGLWSMKQAWLGRAVGILDMFHVLERLWRVAHCLHAENSPEAAEYVGHQLWMLLTGKVGYVIGNWKRLVSSGRVSAARRKSVQEALTYYENNREHMRYDEYLAAGYPIGSGVAEGACRHLVKDRMEQAGMRWTVDGAQAMLHTRAIYLNQGWDEFVEFRIQKEQAALYTQLAA